jgi:hypothetical protein
LLISGTLAKRASRSSEMSAISCLGLSSMAIPRSRSICAARQSLNAAVTV